MSEPSGFSPLNFKDLQDQTLFQLNQRFQFLYSKVGQIFGQSGPNLLSQPTFNTAFASQQKSAKTLQPNEFITKQVADSIYGPAAIQNALNTGVISAFGEQTSQTIQTLQQLGLLGSITYGTHAERVQDYPASSYSLGTLFYETDRTILYYVSNNAAGASIWKYALGVMFDTKANIPEDLMDGDQGFLFFATDWQVLYRCIDAVGACNTSGTDLLIDFIDDPFSQKFDTAWTPGSKYIIVGSTAYSISAIPHDGEITLGSSAGSQSNVAYTVPAGAYRYIDGICVGRYSWILNQNGFTAADYGFRMISTGGDYGMYSLDYTSNAEAGWAYISGYAVRDKANLPDAAVLALHAARNEGLTFFVSDYYHWLQFSGGGYQWHPWEPDGSAYYRLADTAPNWGKWVAASPPGSSKDFLKSDGNLGTQHMATLTTLGTAVWFRQ